MPTNEHSNEPGRRRRRRIRRTLELVLVGAALYLGAEMLSEVGWDTLEGQVRDADVGLVALIIVLLIGRWVLWNFRWRGALHRVGSQVRWLRSLAAIVAAAALNHLTPSFRIFGGLVRARYLSEAPGRRFPTVYGSVLFDQIINQVVMGALSATAFVVLSWRLRQLGQAWAGALAMISIVLLVPLLYRHLRRRGLLPSATGEVDLPGYVSQRLRPLAERGREVVGSLQLLFDDRSLVARSTLLALLYAGCNITAAWLAFAALGAPPPLPWVFLAVSLGVTIGALSGTPGGALTTEAAMVTCYSLLGLDQATALAATLLYRGLHYGLVVALGLPSLLTLEILHRRQRRRR